MQQFEDSLENLSVEILFLKMMPFWTTIICNAKPLKKCNRLIPHYTIQELSHRLNILKKSLYDSLIATLKRISFTDEYARPQRASS